MAIQTTLIMLLNGYTHHVVLSILITSFFCILIHLFLHINRTRPVPLNWPVVGMLPGLLINFHRLPDYITELLRATNCTFSFRGPWFSGMNYVVTCDPDDANYMFNTHFSNFPQGDYRYGIAYDVFGKALANSDGDLWRHERKMAHAQMTNHQFRSSFARWNREKVEKALLPLLFAMAEEESASKVVVELHEILMRFSFDITCKAVFGHDLGSLSPDLPIVPFADALHDMQDGMFLRGVLPQFLWKLMKRLQIGSEKKMTRARRLVDQFLAQLIAERREAKQRRRGLDEEEAPCDILSSTLDREGDDLTHLDRDDANYIQSEKFILDTTMTFLAAGIEGTAHALCWFFHLLLSNPRVEKEILKELRGVSSPFNFEEIDQLVYLHAAICESLRLHPPLPLNYKSPIKEDVLPTGHRVTPGTMVVFVNFVMGKMEAIWGNDCMEFKPERWISVDGKLKHVSSYKFIAFHCGPRLCPGKIAALIEMKMVIAAVVYKFHMTAAKGHIGEPKVYITMPMKNGLLVELRKRSEITTI